MLNLLEKDFDTISENNWSSSERFAEQLARHEAMNLILSWAENKAYAKNGALGSMVLEMVGVDDEEEIDEEEDEEDWDEEDEELYESYMRHVSEALQYLGAPVRMVQAAFSEEDDNAEFRLGSLIKEKLNLTALNDEMIVENYRNEKPSMIAERMVKVVRNGQKVSINRPVRRKRLSPAQRMALKKARMKAHTGAANKHRVRSMKRRKSMGL